MLLQVLDHQHALKFDQTTVFSGLLLQISAAFIESQHVLITMLTRCQPPVNHWAEPCAGVEKNHFMHYPNSLSPDKNRCAGRSGCLCQNRRKTSPGYDLRRGKDRLCTAKLLKDVVRENSRDLEVAGDRFFY
jgi:hypothetical protein